MEAAAERSGLSRATISRIESAKQTILPKTVRLLCQAYGIGAPMIDHLARLAEESEDRGWLVAYSDTVPDWFERYAGEEAEASEIWTYEAEYVPGLLQTADYCRAVRVANSADVPAADVERSVDLRMARQRRLDDPGSVRLRAVVSEGALRRQVGGRDVMRAQLEHIVTMATKPAVTVQVLPFSAGEHPAMTGAFSVLHFSDTTAQPTIFVEVDSGAVYPDRPTDLDRYTWVFSRLTDLALSPDESAGLVSRLVTET